MSALWDKRESGKDWTPEERKDYESLASDADKVNSDLKLRAEYIEQFKHDKSKEDVDFDKSKRDASVFKIIRSMIFAQTHSPDYKGDYGRTNEVLAEHRNKTGGKNIRDGFTPVPESAFRVARPARQKRTDILSSGATGGDSLISETVRPDMYVEGLYEDTWLARAGVPVLSGLEGDVKIPRTDDKPSFAWIAENSNFPEQDMSLDDVTLQPKFAGAIQVFSLGDLSPLTRILHCPLCPSKN